LSLQPALGYTRLVELKPDEITDAPWRPVFPFYEQVLSG
jgi:hypothetical protein